MCKLVDKNLIFTRYSIKLYMYMSNFKFKTPIYKINTRIILNIDEYQ